MTPPSRQPQQRRFWISETQLTALRQGHTHVSAFDKKNILMTVWDDQMCATHTSPPAPAFEIPTADRGDPIAIAYYRGKANGRKEGAKAAREQVLKTLDLWRVKRMNGMLKKDVWKGWNDETDFIESLRAQQQGGVSDERV